MSTVITTVEPTTVVVGSEDSVTIATTTQSVNIEVEVAGPQGATGSSGVVYVDAPITNSGTTTEAHIGIDQTALSISPSQVSGTAVITTDSRLSDARTPTAHASTHGVSGSDPVAISATQVTSGTLPVARGGTGVTTSTGTGNNVLSASPTFTGVPTTPLAAVDTSNNQIASTAFVVNQASSTAPVMDGSATVGTSKRYARADHVHPSDTAKVDTTDSRLSDARTPTAHASTHGVAGSDPVTVASSQVTGLATSATTDTTNADNITSGTLPNARLVSVPNSALANSSVTVNGSSIALGDSATVTAVPSGSAGGDLTGTFPNPTLVATGTAGTYTKVTTDSKGRVTSGTTLLLSDLPAGVAKTGSANAFTVGGHTITANSAVVPLTLTAQSGGSTNAFEVYDNSATRKFYLNQFGNAFFSGSVGSQNNATFTPSGTGVVPLKVQGAVSQTANLQEWQSSAGTVLASINASGIGSAVRWQTGSAYAAIRESNSGGDLFLTRKTATATNPGANVGILYFRDGTTAGTLKLVVRAGTAGAETTILDNIPT